MGDISRITCKYKLKSRKDLADPFRKMSYPKRLINGKAVDLQDNHIIDDLGNGYLKIIPINKTRIVK